MNKKNENRSGYKKTKVGWIPDEWDVKALGEFGAFSKGKGISNAEKKDKGFPCITYGEIYSKYDITIKTFCSYIDQESAIASQRIKKGSILFAGSGETLDEIGKCVSFNHDCEAYAGGDIVIFKPNCADSLFLSFFLNSNHLIRYRRRLGQGHSVVHIYSSGLKTLNVSLPPFPEQKKIAEILSTWDRTIEKTEKLIEKCELRKKGLMQKLLKLGINGNADGWIEVRIGDVLKEVKRPVKWDDSALYPLISVRRRSGGLFLREKLYGHQILTKNMSVALEGDFLISKMQVLHGASGLTTKEFDGMNISGSYIALVPKDSSKFEISYFSWLSKTKEMYHKAYVSSYGVHIEKMTFNFKLYLKEKIRIPATLDEQEKIVAILDTADKEITRYKAKVDALKEQKKGLMQKLLTGEVRVRS